MISWTGRATGAAPSCSKTGGSAGSASGTCSPLLPFRTPTGLRGTSAPYRPIIFPSNAASPSGTFTLCCFCSGTWSVGSGSVLAWTRSLRLLFRTSRGMRSSWGKRFVGIGIESNFGFPKGAQTPEWFLECISDKEFADTSPSQAKARHYSPDLELRTVAESVETVLIMRKDN